MNHRSRKLLDLAHRVQTCTNCGRWTDGCEPAHQNGLASGKGIGIKGDDWRHAALCHDCHSFLDQGAGKDPSGCYTGSRADKQAMWQAAHMKTLAVYFDNEWLRVTA